MISCDKATNSRRRKSSARNFDGCAERGFTNKAELVNKWYNTIYDNLSLFKKLNIKKYCHHKRGKLLQVVVQLICICRLEVFKLAFQLKTCKSVAKRALEKYREYKKIWRWNWTLLFGDHNTIQSRRRIKNSKRYQE